MSFYHVTKVKSTRKDCQCDWCHEDIKTGDPSVTVSQVYMGDLFYNRYHPECNEAVGRWSKIPGNEELPLETMNRGGIQPYGEDEYE